MKHYLGGFVGRSVALMVFFSVGLLVFGYFYLGIGGYVPFLTDREYTLGVEIADADNLVQASHVSEAGVQIGAVRSIEREPNRLKVVFEIDSKYAPLHRGVRIRLGERSLVGESYFDVTDGAGPALASGSVIPGADFMPSTQLHDVLHSLDPTTRAAMSGMLRSLGAGTVDTHQDVSGLLAGMGGLGRDGNTALDAIAAQSDDVRALGRDLSTLMQTLDTGQGRIVEMVTSADRLTKATSAQKTAIAATMNELPRTMDAATTASADVTKLSGALAPVVQDLRAAAPFLDDGLVNLPSVSKDLRALMPALSQTMSRSNSTFDRVPRFTDASRDVIPAAAEFVRDLNPMLSYLAPYGPEMGGFFANLNASWAYTNGNGMNAVRVFAMLNDRSVGQTPVAFNGPLTYDNPYPAPGSQPRPGPWNGVYPRVERLPR